MTNDGRDLAEFFRRIFRGEKIDEQEPTFQDRLRAAEWLADRGFGRPTQPISGDEDRPPVQLSQTELFALIQYVTAGALSGAAEPRKVEQAETEKPQLEAGKEEK